MASHKAVKVALLMAVWGIMLSGSLAAAEETGQKATEGASPAIPASRPSGGMNAPRQLESTPLEDLLLEKGVITIDDWIRIKAEEEQKQSERSVVAEFTGSPRWYERITMYGYGMFRYNMVNNYQFRAYQDASVGSAMGGAQPGFFFRRIRWVVTGQVSDHVSFFIQPDLASASSASGFVNTHVLSMRDAFGDWNFDKDKEFRLRVGLQRVPCSFDNWQASRVRMAIDRADGTNSCANSERDMGIAFMWTPKIAQQRYKQMLDYMYGPGDYGVFHIQVYNGQGLNQPELNNNKHVGMRLSWPWELPGGRLMETGMNAMTGQFQVNPGATSRNTAVTATATTFAPLLSVVDSSHTSNKYLDERLNFYIYFPPQPFGFIAEYTMGKGPKRGADGVIRSNNLYGGYFQAHYQWKYSDVGLANFYSRYQEYHGGLKFQTGAPDDRMKELETGIAWQPDPQWEFTVAYSIAQRLNVFSSTGGTVGTSQQFDTYANLIRFQIVWFWN